MLSANQVGPETLPAAPAPRRSRRWLRLEVLLAALSVAVSTLAPQVSEVPAGLTAILGAHLGWLALAVVLALVPYLGAAVALQGAVPTHLPYAGVTQVQIAGAFAAVAAPAGMATMALTFRYLERTGIPRGQAIAAIGVARATATAVHLLLLALLAPVVLDRVSFTTPSWIWPVAALPVLTVAGIVVWCRPTLRTRALTALVSMLSALRKVTPNVPRAGQLLVGSAAISTARGMALFSCLQAMGASIPVLAVVGLFLAAEAAGILATTPAGLGVLDGIVLAGLAAFGVAAPSAIAAVLLYRLLTFWGPLLLGALTLGHLRRTRLV